ncbi:hypothetical protein [Pseudomonas tremae]|uniref:hypothetical protein n=2 Tax=Pseudomonas TaxID=286 RepID=UPI001F439982|nr:hypothetical protein [Pseudomonas tremae]MCF5811226.1 hypothetical protein [Pseudomonas tremae]
MAHLRCQACNARVSECDVTCPVCNVLIVKSRNPWLILILVMLLCVVVAAMIWSLSVSGNRSTDKSEVAELSDRQGDSKIEAAALDAVLQSMKDPDSTRFGDDLSVNHIQGKNVVCGSVNSKNSFGGFSGFKRFLYFYESKQLAIEPKGDFDRLWHLFC